MNDQATNGDSSRPFGDVETDTLERLFEMAANEDHALSASDEGALLDLLNAFHELRQERTKLRNECVMVAKARDLYRALHESDQRKLARISEVANGPVIV